jgi:xanthine dehydrogenase YagS FAD-binding subunit
MKDIAYARTDSVSAAIDLSRSQTGSLYLAGGTTVVDLLREGVFNPAAVLDISGLAFREIKVQSGFLVIGAMVPNSEVAWNPAIQSTFPVVAQALLSGASGQIRNMASTGGNVLQRTRCPYYRDLNASCNKRDPGTGCAAIGGYNRSQAILGGSEHCIATHASDFAVALMATDARLQLTGPQGDREIALADFYLLPRDTPHRENVLRPHELIVAVKLPQPAAPRKSLYLKVRDRKSYEFALASAAVGADADLSLLRNVRIALGGVATLPWRCRSAEQLLEGQAPSLAGFTAAAEAALAGAQPHRDNAFKVPLAKRTLISALQNLTGVS